MTNTEFKKAVKKITEETVASVYASKKHLENNEIILRFGITKEEWAKRFCGSICEYDAVADMQEFKKDYLPKIEALGCVGTPEITARGDVYIRLHIGA